MHGWYRTVAFFRVHFIVSYLEASPLMDQGNPPPLLMFGQLRTCKMMVGMVLMQCVVTSTPPHFVVDVKKIIGSNTSPFSLCHYSVPKLWALLYSLYSGHPRASVVRLPNPSFEQKTHQWSPGAQAPSRELPPQTGTILGKETHRGVTNGGWIQPINMNWSHIRFSTLPAAPQSGFIANQFMCSS